jgi:perosamine synthetase
MSYIPVYQPSLTGNEKKYVNECLDSTWISSKGDFIPRFEQAFAQFTGTRHAATCSNGTVAIHLALVALGLGPGDEVIVPTLTYIASVNAIVYTGATPVFVDSVAETWQISADDVRAKITPRTRAIMAVHLYGHPCDMPALRALADEHGLFLVEDCAEAFGSYIGKRHVGSFGHISTYSFFGNKTITTGEGGMVTTDDETLHDRVKHYKGQGLAKHRQYWHDVVGYNYRMTNICAAIGLAQLEQAQLFLQRKRAIALNYARHMDEMGLDYLRESPGTTHSFWMFAMLVPDARQREALRDALQSAGIETRPVFYPVHTMPMYSQRFQRHPVAENIGWRGINLPSSPELSNDDINRITTSIESFFKIS